MGIQPSPLPPQPHVQRAVAAVAGVRGRVADHLTADLRPAEPARHVALQHPARPRHHVVVIVATAAPRAALAGDHQHRAQAVGMAAPDEADQARCARRPASCRADRAAPRSPRCRARSVAPCVARAPRVAGPGRAGDAGGSCAVTPAAQHGRRRFRRLRFRAAARSSPSPSNSWSGSTSRTRGLPRAGSIPARDHVPQRTIVLADQLAPPRPAAAFALAATAHRARLPPPHRARAATARETFRRCLVMPARAPAASPEPK